MFGKKAYVVSAIISIFSHKNTPFTILVDGKELIEGMFTLVTVCNGQYYGGNMRIAPSAEINDGLITLCLVSAMGRLKAFTLFPIMLLEKHTRLKAIKYIECKRVTLMPEDSTTLCMDGNLYKRSEPLDFKILPRAIRIFAEGCRVKV